MYCAFYFFTKNLVISQPYFVAKDLLFSWLLSLACFAVLCKREVGLVSIDTWQHIQQKALAHSQTPVCLCSRQHDEIQMLIKATFSQSQRKLSKCNSLMLPFPLGCMGKRGCEHGDCAAGVSRAEEFPPQFFVRGPGFLAPHTDLPVAGCAQGLQVLQGALSSSTVHGLDVIHLPELPLCRAPDHLVQLQHTKDRAGIRHSSTTWTSHCRNKEVLGSSSL